MRSEMEAEMNYRVGVLGAGSWGTALANLLATKGYSIDWWVFEAEVCQQIQETGMNSSFMDGFQLSSNLHPTTDIGRAVRDKDILLVVVPSHVMREVSQKSAPFLNVDTVVVSASKGIENQTQLTMSGVLMETLTDLNDRHLAVLSGPSFAREVIQGLPTVVTAASRDRDCALLVQSVFATPVFRVYTNDDVIGVELGGSVKNVIAIAAGIIDGLGMGLNTRAALITRGLTEIRRLGVAMGANPRTFTGTAGVGDLVLTCTGDLSRNHTVGYQIGKGKHLNELVSEMRMVAEGVKTAQSVYQLADRLGVEMPICQAVYQILYEGLSPKLATQQLMTRDLKQELDDV